MKELHIARGFRLPDEAVTQTFAILAKRGVGKTYTAAVMVEEMVKAGLPVVVADPIGVWWGLRSSADGKRKGLPVTILGGEHGDIPLEPAAGEVIADTLVDNPFPAVLDLGLFRKGEQIKFMTAFAERLYQRNRSALHLVLDEADAFAPQKTMKGEGAERLLGAIEDIVRRGRARGLGVTLITQRPAVLNKNVLTQVEVLVALRTISPQDRTAIDKWVEIHGEEAEQKELQASIASLPIGEAYFWSPGWLDVFKRVKVRQRETFDSSATPKAGERTIEPRAFADVDLGAIQEAMAATIEKAKADDPKELRRQIAELRRELAAAQKEQPTPEPEVREVKIPFVEDEQLAALRDAAEKLDSIAGNVLKAATSIDDRITEITGELTFRPAGGSRLGLGERLDQPRKVADPLKPRAAPPPASRPAPAASVMTPVNGDGPPIKAGARRMLEAVASLHPMPLTRAQVGTLAKVKRTGGTYTTYLSVLKQHGYLVEDGDRLTITQAGFDALGTEPPAPASPDDLRAMWRDRLKAGARRMLDILIDQHPEWLTRQELADAADVAVTGGTFSTYLGMLRTAGLIDEEAGQIRANDVLFFGVT